MPNRTAAILTTVLAPLIWGSTYLVTTEFLPPNRPFTAALSVPSPEHYLPLLYTAALREPQDNMEIFNDELAFGSISMTSVLIG